MDLANFKINFILTFLVKYSTLEQTIRCVNLLLFYIKNERYARTRLLHFRKNKIKILFEFVVSLLSL